MKPSGSELYLSEASLEAENKLSNDSLAVHQKGFVGAEVAEVRALLD